MEEQAKWFGPLDQPILWALASASYCYFLLNRIPRGKPRLVALIPVLYLFSLFPWRFSSPVGRALSSFFVTWLTSFKLLLFCFGQGPLLHHQSFADFALIAFLPLKIRKRGDDDEEVRTPAFVPRYELVPISNQPYFATSLRDFWGKRWNRMSSDLLRQTVYDPIRSSLSGSVGPRGARLAATAATLVVSGLLHEMVLFYITCGRKPTWEVAWFFALHGAGMVLETGIKAWWCRANGWAPLNPVASGVLTISIATVSCYWMLVLPVWRNSARECRFT